MGHSSSHRSSTITRVIKNPVPFPFLGGELLFFLGLLGCLTGDLDLRAGGDLDLLGGEGDWCLSGLYLRLGYPIRSRVISPRSRVISPRSRVISRGAG